jgi:APA family basic amino acid/polyamine antiporter
MLGVIFCLVLMLSLPLLTWIRFGIWLSIGLVIYFFYGVSHSRVGRGAGGGDTATINPAREL